MTNKFTRLADLLLRQLESAPDFARGAPFSLIDPFGNERVVGSGSPSFSLHLRNDQAIAAISTMDQEHIAKAYMMGYIDVKGDFIKILSLRSLFSDQKGFKFLWRILQPLLFGQVKSDRKWIAQHYEGRYL